VSPARLPCRHTPRPSSHAHGGTRGRPGWARGVAAGGRRWSGGQCGRRSSGRRPWPAAPAAVGQELLEAAQHEARPFWKRVVVLEHSSEPRAGHVKSNHASFRSTVATTGAKAALGQRSGPRRPSVPGPTPVVACGDISRAVFRRNLHSIAPCARKRAGGKTDAGGGLGCCAPPGTPKRSAGFWPHQRARGGRANSVPPAPERLMRRGRGATCSPRQHFIMNRLLPLEVLRGRAQMRGLHTP